MLGLLVAAMLGRGGGTTYTFDWTNILDFDNDPGTAFCSITLHRDGTGSFVGNAPLNSVATETWIEPREFNTGDSFEVRMLRDAGNTPGGASVNVWLPLTSDLTWSASQSGVGENVIGLTAQLRRSGKTNILAENSFSLSAIVESAGGG